MRCVQYSADSVIDKWLVSKSDKAARKMNLATNAEVFQHSLNRFPEAVRDPRSQMQRLEDPTLTNDKLKRLMTKELVDQAEIGFTPTPVDADVKPSALLTRQDSRVLFHLNKRPKHEWEDKDIVIALGHERLTAKADDTV